MMTHTPGPWLIEPTDNTPRGHWLHDDRHQYVALAVGRDDGGRDMEMANARLIAAAPELLSALGNLLALIDANAGRITGGEVEFGEARSAIAKAEGLS